MKVTALLTGRGNNTLKDKNILETYFKALMEDISFTCKVLKENNISVIFQSLNRTGDTIRYIIFSNLINEYQKNKFINDIGKEHPVYRLIHGLIEYINCRRNQLQTD